MLNVKTKQGALEGGKKDKPITVIYLVYLLPIFFKKKHPCETCSDRDNWKDWHQMYSITSRNGSSDPNAELLYSVSSSHYYVFKRQGWHAKKREKKTKKHSVSITLAKGSICVP